MIKINSHRLNKDNAVDFFSEWSGQALQKKAEEPTYDPERSLGVLRPNDIQQLYNVGESQGYKLDQINALLMYSGDTLLKNTAFGVASDRTKSELAMAAAGIPIGAILGGLLGGGKGMLAGSVIGTIALYIMSKFGVGVEEAMSYSQDALATRNTQAIKNLLTVDGQKTPEGEALAKKIKSMTDSPADIGVSTQLDLLVKANNLPSKYKDELADRISGQLKNGENVNATAKYEGLRTLQILGYNAEQNLEQFRQDSALYEADNASTEALKEAISVAAQGNISLSDDQKKAIQATAHIRSINQSELENVKNRIETIRVIDDPSMNQEIASLTERAKKLSEIESNLAERAKAAGSAAGFTVGEDAGPAWFDGPLSEEVPDWAQPSLNKLLVNPVAAPTPATTPAAAAAATAPAATPPVAQDAKPTATNSSTSTTAAAPPAATNSSSTTTTAAAAPPAAAAAAPAAAATTAATNSSTSNTALGRILNAGWAASDSNPITASKALAQQSREELRNLAIPAPETTPTPATTTTPEKRTDKIKELLREYRPVGPIRDYDLESARKGLWNARGKQ
jgi:predicted  nucleic acid-binding Zn-ribbon protein